MAKGITKGHLWWKYYFFTICSRHQHSMPNSNCQLCEIGEWRNAWKNSISRKFYKFFPKTWKFVVNFKIKR